VIKVFKNGRDLAAFLGLVPKQRSSGDKIILQGISKRGNRYLRRLLIHGARAVMKYSDKKTDKRSRWITEKKREVILMLLPWRMPIKWRVMHGLFYLKERNTSMIMYKYQFALSTWPIQVVRALLACGLDG